VDGEGGDLTPAGTTQAPASAFCDAYRVEWSPRDSEAPRFEADARLREALRVALRGSEGAS